MENEETISELMADYANGLKFYCKKNCMPFMLVIMHVKIAF